LLPLTEEYRQQPVETEPGRLMAKSSVFTKRRRMDDGAVQFSAAV
jgi:hypothetical protein